MFACFKAIGKGGAGGEYWQKREVLSKSETVRKGAALIRNTIWKSRYENWPVEHYALSWLHICVKYIWNFKSTPSFSQTNGLHVNISPQTET